MNEKDQIHKAVWGCDCCGDDDETKLVLLCKKCRDMIKRGKK